MTTDGKTGLAIARPNDPYDAAAWLAFYASNPGLRRAVGADATDDEPPTDPKPADGDNPAKKPGAEGDKDGKKPADKEPTDKDVGDKKPTDKEAELLKDVMRQKEKAKKAEAELAEVRSKLKDFEGLDASEIRKLLDEKAKAEESAALARGEFDKVKARMVEQHTAALKTRDEKISGMEAENAALRQQIDDLTVGSSFGQSKFVRDTTVLSPAKARQLYGQHFDIVEGNVVGYDKPRGVEGRSPIVDAAGNPLPFENAIKAIIEADPDKEMLLRSALKPGADSTAPKKAPESKSKANLTGMDKIRDGLAKRAGN